MLFIINNHRIYFIRTLLEQSAIITVMGIPFLQGTLEDMTVRGFDSTSANGRRGIIDITEEIKTKHNLKL